MAMKNVLKVGMLLWLILESRVKSLPRGDVNICNFNVCPAGKHEYSDGTCTCCLVCESLFKRKNTANSCPMTRADCSDECIAGFRNEPTFKGNLDICIPEVKETVTTESTSTTDIEDWQLEKAREKEKDTTPSSDESGYYTTDYTVIGGVVGGGISLGVCFALLFVIYKKRCKRFPDDSSSSDNSIVESCESEQENEWCPPEKVAVEDADAVTARDNNCAIINKTEDTRQSAQPIDEYNPNQTFGLNHNNGWRINGIPPRIPEIPTAPIDSHDSISTIYPNNFNAFPDSGPSYSNHSNNTQDAQLNFRLELEVSANLSRT